MQVECRGTLTDQQGHSQLSISEIIAMQPGSCNPNNLLCGVYSSSDPNQHDAASSQKLPSKLTLHSDYTYRITHFLESGQRVESGAWHLNALEEIVLQPGQGDRISFQILYDKGALVPNGGKSDQASYYRMWL